MEYRITKLYNFFPSEAFELADQVDKTDGVYFVPAFSGLFAPHWRSDARGTLCGLTGHSTKQHVSRYIIVNPSIVMSPNLIPGLF